VNIEEVLFDVAEALETPVIIAVVLALAYGIVEFGALVAELWKRRKRNRAELERAIGEIYQRLAQGDTFNASIAAERVAWSKPMSNTLAAIVEMVTQPNAESRVAKELADFDYRCIKRLERTRILVRMGPALGLMGTLIPLSPALAGLAAGDVDTLTENLRVAFSVTVTGLLAGALAFAVSLTRDRLYGQDFSDAEYLAQALLTAFPQGSPQPQATPHAALPPPIPHDPGSVGS
jgi:biopolymer transport protein ExbB/TolQ